MKAKFLSFSLPYNLISLFFVLSQILAIPTTQAAIPETQAKEQYEIAKNLINTYSGTGNNYEQAVALADDIHKSAPQSPYSDLIIAELMARLYKDYRQGNPNEIWALTDKIISIDPLIANTFVVRSKIALADGDLQRAQSEVDHALLLDAKNKEAMFAKASAEQEANHFDQAENWYLKTIEAHVDPDRKSNIYFWLSQMYLKTTPKQISKADKFMEESAKLSPAAPWTLVNYAIFLNTSMGNYDKAAEYAKKALNIMEFPMGRLQLGMAKYAQWAITFTKTSNPTSNQLTQAKTDILAIQKETGITPAEASKYASQYMKLDLPKAFSTAGVL